MGFSVTEKGIGYSGGHLSIKSNRAGRIESASAKSYFQEMHESSMAKSGSARQASAVELYERMRRFQAMAEEDMPETDSPAEGTGQTADAMAEKARSAESEAASSQKETQEDSETDTEIIVKPDGSRVLVVTMNVGGTETSMTLEISKPTALPNGNQLLYRRLPTFLEIPGHGFSQRS